MNRRTLPAIIVAGLIVASAIGGWWWRGGRPSDGRRFASSGSQAGPIILISIDTLRADRLAVYGSTRTTTPTIDALAADGVTFENAYAHSPQTLPSHTSILSGELPFRHGVRDNIGFEIRPGQRFLQHELKEAGFATGGFVSSYVLRRQTGFGQGFDTFDDQLPAASPEQPLGQVQRGGEQTIAAAVKWIDAQASGRFFLFAHIYEPHTPYSPPPRFAPREPYDGEVEYADQIIGRLLDHLRARGLYDQAAVVLFSDHGEGLGDHGEEEHGIFLYRETIRVPLIMKMPGGRNGPARVAAPVQHVDIVPTILEMVGAPASRAVSAEAGASGERQARPGRSLLPLIDGTGSIEAAHIYSESLSPRYHFGWSELYALSDDRYRLIRAPKDELYDLAQDPRELRSIAAERGQVRAAMRSAVDAVVANAGISAPSAVSDEDRQKLAALGYVGTQTGTVLRRPSDQLPDPKDKVEVLRMYRAAGRLAAARKDTEAAALFRKILDSDPGMTDVWLQLAEAQSRQGRFDSALAAYKEVIGRDPKNPAALTGATAALLRAGRIDEAKAHADLAVTVAPATAHETLARIAVHQRDAATARRHAQLAQQADPSLPMEAFIDGMILHGQAQYDAAARRLLEAKAAMAARTEQVADLNYLAADSLARLERYAEAEPLFKAELAVFPQHVRARAGLAMMYRAMGRTAEAERTVEELVRLSATPEAYDTAARLWTMFGEPGRAAAVRAAAARLRR